MRFGLLLAWSLTLSAQLYFPPAGEGGSAASCPRSPARGRSRKHDFLYWEFYERGSAQAVRMGKWKGIRKPMFSGPVELYDLALDPGEKYNVARGHRDVVKEIEAIMARAHAQHPNWRVT